ncbi:MAG: IS66 family transposase [Thermomicrobiales bacterium]
MSTDERIQHLEAENAALRRAVEEAQARIAELERQIGAGRPPVPELAIRPSKRLPPGPKAPRRKRAAHHNRGRRRAVPTRTVEHALERCPECEYRLRGRSLAYARQVVELPEPAPVEVIEHRVLKRYCPKCQRWRHPKVDLAARGEVLGQGRLGTGLLALIAYLRHTLRLPFELIQQYLQTCHGCSLSQGALVDQLRQVQTAPQMKAGVEQLRQAIRASPILHADETGWREDGVNGYLWSFTTPGREPVRYYTFDPSRGQIVPRRVLGHAFQGHLVSDFYAGYNAYAGPHQRCWVHLLRDLRALKEAYPDQPAVIAWATQVRALYDQAQAWLAQAGEPTSAEREAQSAELVTQVHRLGLAHAQDRTHPAWALAKRLLRHEDELFQFVLVPGLAADNNLAERSIRPQVVARKISGGTRSAAGTQAHMDLASLFATWQARGLNPFEACLHLLRHGSAPAPA